MSARKRFQVFKFLGRMYAVVDVVSNSTLGVHPTRETAKAVAAKLNQKKGDSK